MKFVASDAFNVSCVLNIEDESPEFQEWNNQRDCLGNPL
jgi:hypothetical protein